jgi:hypothetical protein
LCRVPTSHSNRIKLVSIVLAERATPHHPLPTSLTLARGRSNASSRRSQTRLWSLVRLSAWLHPAAMPMLCCRTAPLQWHACTARESGQAPRLEQDAVGYACYVHRHARPMWLLFTLISIVMMSLTRSHAIARLLAQARTGWSSLTLMGHLVMTALELVSTSR